tara:strand:+ start:75 stop:287 length:213 start_codon:yes stop_codon:yes gene_type:complete
MVSVPNGVQLSALAAVPEDMTYRRIVPLAVAEEVVIMHLNQPLPASTIEAVAAAPTVPVAPAPVVTSKFA